MPTVEKRRKVAPLSSLVYSLEENDVDEDIRMIFKVGGAFGPDNVTSCCFFPHREELQPLRKILHQVLFSHSM